MAHRKARIETVTGLLMDATKMLDELGLDIAAARCAETIDLVKQEFGN